jgi:hypothetical protein
MIQIDELVMRIPGLGAEQGRQLGEDVARRVAVGLPEGVTDRHIPEVNIRINVSAGSDPGRLAESVAEQIIIQLTLATL